MEPPAGASADALRDEKVKVFRQIATLDPSQVVRGQYRGYVDELGVAPGSDVETFAALRFHIDSWRWSGVPWLIRSGKELPVSATEAIVTFHEPPNLLFVDPDGPDARAQPDPVPHQSHRRRGAAPVLQGAGRAHGQRARRPRRRVRGGLRPPPGGLPTPPGGRHGRRPPPVRPGRHHRRAVAHRQPPHRRPEGAPRPLRQGHLGPRGRRVAGGGPRRLDHPLPA